METGKFSLQGNKKNLISNVAAIRRATLPRRHHHYVYIILYITSVERAKFDCSGNKRWYSRHSRVIIGKAEKAFKIEVHKFEHSFRKSVVQTKNTRHVISFSSVTKFEASCLQCYIEESVE